MTPGNFLSEQTIETVLAGKHENGLKGVVELCGISGKFSDSLKNSSHTAMDLLWRLLSNSCILISYHLDQKDVYREVFLSLEIDLIKDMKLDYHLGQKEEKRQSSLNVIGFLNVYCLT